MKKESYIQYGLLAIVVGLILFRSREGFEEATEAKCSSGSIQRGKVCINPSGPSTPATCPSDTQRNGQGQCVGESGISEPPSVCPQGKESLYGKCYDPTPLCGTNTEYVMTFTSAGFPDKGLCVPNSRTTYEMTLPQGRPPTRDEMAAACRPGDKMIGKFTGLEGPQGVKTMCLSMASEDVATAGTTPTTTTTGASVGATGTTTTSTSTTTPTTTTTTTATTTPTTTTPQGATTSQGLATSATPVNNSLPAKIREVTDSLKPFRPPTAPSSDLEKERKEITNLATRNLYFIQIALFLVVLSMLSYFMFSLDTANLIAFGLLCVGIALGFFLRR